MSDAIELRVLTGRHSGARAPVQGGERIGASDDCDLVLTDLGLGEDVFAWLQLRAGRWSLDAQAPEQPAESTAPSSELAHPLGAISYLGEQAVTVCAAHLPWQRAPLLREPATTRQVRAVEDDELLVNPLPKQVTDAAPTLPTSQDAVQAPDVEDLRIDPAVQVQPSNAVAKDRPSTSASSPRRLHKLVGVIALVLIAVLLALLWSVMAGGRKSPIPEANASMAPVVDIARQQQWIKDAQLAIARVDPALRLKVDALPSGGVRVSGWVGDVSQLDQLAEGLAALRPLPQMAVRTASDLRDDMMDAAGSEVRNPGFEFIGAGQVKATGLVQDVPERDRLLALVRARMPEGMEIVDGLRVASEQGAALQSWLKSAGFPESTAKWEDGQMRIAVNLAAPDRGRFENLLARKDIPLTGIPFSLQVNEIAVRAAAAQAPAALIHASAAPQPIRMRSVVSGPAPYVVLMDGTRLQPGGQRGGWTLVSVDSDRIVFKGPQTLMVAR